MTRYLCLFFLLPAAAIKGQHVGIGTTTPVEKLEVKSPLRSTIRISSTSFSDTTELCLSNRSGTFGTDFSIKNIQEEGLFFSSTSDLPANTSNNSLVILPNGRVGVKTPAPGYAFDVNGDINTNGVLRTNGNAGSAGQLLSINGNGTMSWIDLNEYRSVATFRYSGTAMWNVPAGVTRVLVEVWGGGGGGSFIAGGGGGGYVMGIFNVTPGEVVNYTVGAGGPGGASGTNGASSSVTIGAVTLTAFGGQGSVYDEATVSITAGSGGDYSVTAGFYNYVGQQGNQGTCKTQRFFTYNTTTYQETAGGNGGDAGHSSNTGGMGRYRIQNMTGASPYLYGIPEIGKQPGGGGGSGVGGIGLAGGNGVGGGIGLVVIHY